MNDVFAAEGVIFDRHGSREGWVIAEGGKVQRIGHGQCPIEPATHGFIVADVVNMHTHSADYGLSIRPGMSLTELVAPPDGLKHRYLRDAEPSDLIHNMRRFSRDSRGFGSRTFVDFREGGEAGCRMLRGASEGAVILGRPVSKEFDPAEVERILKVADGIGLPSISDMDYSYIESVADMVREKGKIFAIHASERVREDIDLVLSLDPAFVVHMCEATDDDIVKCAEAEVPIVVCPTSNTYFGKACPASRASGLGADIAIGTDNGMLCHPNLFKEAASLLDTGLDPEECIQSLVSSSGKILNLVETHSMSADPGPVTVLPASDADASEALRRLDDAIRLE